jgi:transcriptional regulator with GAF, ATPase, and Fis domain
MGKKIEGIEPEALRRLEVYEWPGNVRELENTIERAVALETAKRVSVENLPERVTSFYQESRSNGHSESKAFLIPDAGMDLEKLIGSTERAYLLAALECSGGVRIRAAEMLKMTYARSATTQKNTAFESVSLRCGLLTSLHSTFIGVFRSRLKQKQSSSTRVEIISLARYVNTALTACFLHV